MIYGIPIKIKLNHTLLALLSLLLSLAAGLLLYFWEPGQQLIAPLFFAAGLFYVQLLFLLSVPLIGLSLWQGAFLLRRAWDRKQLSPRLALYYGIGTAGAVFVGIGAGFLAGENGGSFFTAVRPGMGLLWLQRLLPPLAVLCFFAGSVSGREEVKTVPAGKLLESLTFLFQRTGEILLRFLPVGLALLLIPLLALSGIRSLWLCLQPVLLVLFFGVVYVFFMYGFQLRRCGKACPGNFWHFFRQTVLEGVSTCSFRRCAGTAMHNLMRLGVQEGPARSIWALGGPVSAVGTGLYCGILCFAAARFTGRPIGWEWALMALLFCLLTGFSRLDFPGGGLFRGLFLVLLLGIPPEGALPFVIMERFFDCLRTGMNVLAVGVGAYLSDKLQW